MTEPYAVIKCTTDSLARALNDAVGVGGMVVDQIRWVGGRDWVVIAHKPDLS